MLLVLVSFILGLSLQAYETSNTYWATYYGEFGLYGNRLSLRNDSTFVYSYFGCSQSVGYETGNYSFRSDTLILNRPDTTTRYLVSGNYIIRYPLTGYADTMKLPTAGDTSQ